MISVVYPQDALVVLPAAVGATVLYHKNLQEYIILLNVNIYYEILNWSSDRILSRLESEVECAVGGEHDAGLGEGARKVEPASAQFPQVVQQPLRHLAAREHMKWLW